MNVFVASVGETGTSTGEEKEGAKQQELMTQGSPQGAVLSSVCLRYLLTDHQMHDIKVKFSLLMLDSIR